MTNSVAQHYGNDGIVRIISALSEAGFDTNDLEPDVFAGLTSFT